MSLNKKQIKSLERVINYMYDNEEKHYEEDNTKDRKQSGTSKHPELLATPVPPSGSPP